MQVGMAETLTTDTCVIAFGDTAAAYQQQAHQYVAARRATPLGPRARSNCTATAMSHTARSGTDGQGLTPA
ncbi:MAG TPA: hypothetical protein VE442_11155 [Jatrophihabitans sp.]|jgi:hypothetical protein|nr:hypothetical protein [Jatrophihabitans sp.]